jgi:geranylgeranyl pyrophosphate synthase
LIKLRDGLDENGRRKFNQIVKSKDRSDLIRLLDSSNALDETMETARRMVGKAQSRLDVLPAGPARDLLLELSKGVLTRHS